VAAEPGLSYPISNYTYSPQLVFPLNTHEINTTQGSDLTIDISAFSINYLGGANNRYQWFRDGTAITAVSSSPVLSLTNIGASDFGIYTCHVTNVVATDLTLISEEITLINNNSAPIVQNPIADRAENKCFGSLDIDLTNVFSDANGDVLTFTAISGNTNVVTVGINGSTLTLTEIGTGISQITITATDGTGMEVNDVFMFTVNDLDNSDPVFSSGFAAQTLYAGQNCTAQLSDYTTILTINVTDNCTASNNLSITQLPVAGTSISGATNTITITATDEAGNTAEQSFNVAVVDNLAPVFNAYNDITVCVDAGLTTKIVNFTSPTASDNCTTPTVNQTGGMASGSAFPIGTNTITYRATDATGNFTELSFNVIVTESSVQPSAASSPESPYCAESLSQITLSYSGGTLMSGATAHWYNDATLSNEVATGNNATIPAPDQNSTYYVRFEGACNTTNAVALNIVVYPLPVINAGEDATIIDSETLQLSATNNNNLDYVWTPSDMLNTPDIYNPIFTPVSTGTYRLTVTVTNENNCVNSDDIEITVQPPVVKIYNAFTPNGDGVNDFWIIENIDLYPNSELKVFDRNNVLVFKSQGYKNDWRGTFDSGDGKQLLPGTYFYILEFGDNIEGVRETCKKGTVTILNNR
jgi:gliding motility-associated-like protein